MLPVMTLSLALPVPLHARLADRHDGAAGEGDVVGLAERVGRGVGELEVRRCRERVGGDAHVGQAVPSGPDRPHPVGVVRIAGHAARREVAVAAVADLLRPGRCEVVRREERLAEERGAEVADVRVAGEERIIDAVAVARQQLAGVVARVAGALRVAVRVDPRPGGADVRGAHRLGGRQLRALAEDPDPPRAREAHRVDVAEGLAPVAGRKGRALLGDRDRRAARVDVGPAVRAAVDGAQHLARLPDRDPDLAAGLEGDRRQRDLRRAEAARERAVALARENLRRGR